MSWLNRHPHRQRGPFGRHHPRFRSPLTWWLTRGIHRTLLRFLILSAVVCGIGGAWIQRSWTEGTHTWITVTIGMLFSLWVLAWSATVRIAGPLHHLAHVAGQLHDGKLESREDLRDTPDGLPEMTEVSHALRGMAERVAKQLRDQRSLMAAVSHELRSPLGRARVLIEMSREGSASATVHDELQAEIDAMDGLVGDLLAAARIDFEAVNPVDLESADLAHRALQLARMSEDLLQIDGSAGIVHADPTLLTRALATLLDNAQRYGGKAVALRVRGRHHRVRFEVEDDGPGFSPGDEIRAFEPFWRGPAENAPKGEGLGLALVRQIAQAHQGEAGAENRPEGGARVWIELPRGN